MANERKTKLGVPVGLLSGTLYFMGIINIVPLIMLAMYILHFEEIPSLKRAAVKAVVIVVLCGAITALLGLVGNAQSVLQSLFSLARINADMSLVSGIISISGQVVSFLRTAILLVCAYRAMNGRDPKIGLVDDAIDDDNGGVINS